jgi:hypothetical protein
MYSSTNIIRMFKSRKIIRKDHVADMREKRNAIGVLVGKPEGKSPVGRP